MEIRWTKGTTRCRPGYSVPGCTPEIWLIRTPPDPSGTMATLSATSRGAHAQPNNFAASGHRMGRLGPACPAGKPAFSAAPGSPERISFWNCIARYTSYATTPAAVPNIATPAAISNHFSANMTFSFRSGGLQVADAPKRFGDGAYSPHPAASPSLLSRSSGEFQFRAPCGVASPTRYRVADSLPAGSRRTGFAG